MKKIILTLFGFILSVMSVYAQVAPVAGLTVVPNNAANPTIISLSWAVYVQGTTPATDFVVERSPNTTTANFVVIATIQAIGTTYIDNVTPDNYCYRVKAINNATPVAASAYSPIICISLPTPVAPIVTAMPNIPTAPTSIDLSWTQAGTATTTTRFLIERSSTSATTGFSLIGTILVPFIGIPSTFTYTDTPLTPSNYYYRVRAANAFLFSPYSAVASVIIPALATPGTLTVTPNAAISTSNALSWGATPNATAYDVEVSSTLTGTYVLLASVPAPAVTYAHNMTGGNYCYRIRATVGSAVSSYNTAVCTTPIPCASAILDQATNLTASINVQVTSASLTWDDNASGETGYKIYRSTTMNFSSSPLPAVPFAVAIQNATGYADNTIVANITYYYVVVPYCGTTNGLTLSDELEVVLGLASATEFTAITRPNEFVIDLQWMSNVSSTARENGYDVERSIESPAPNWQFLKFVPIPPDTSVRPPTTGAGLVRKRYITKDNGDVIGMPLLPNTRYCYRVRSKINTPLALSEFSISACASTQIIEAPTNLTAIAEVIEDGDYVTPTNNDPTTGTTPKILLTWKDNSILETKYIIERKRDNVTPAQTFKVIGTVTTLLGQKVSVSFKDSLSVTLPRPLGLVPGAKYCYRVRAEITGGSLSNYSNETCATAYDVATSVDVKLSNAVKLYPNPASKNFMISFEGVNIRANKAEIINIVGQKVTEQDLTVTSEISLQNIKAGLYYIRIQSDKGTILKKLVVEN